MKKLFVTLALLGASVSASYAQGSPYNLLGFGTPVVGADPVSASLGGSSVALEGSRTVNTVNPADWTWLTRTRFETALRYEYAKTEAGSTSGAFHSVHFSGITFGAPLWNAVNGAIAAGYEPLTDASAEIHVADSLGERTYRSRGGANVAFLGLAMRPFQSVSVGARLDLLTGNIRHEDQAAFNDPAVAASTFERDYYFHGLRPTIGLEFTGDSMSVRGLSVGIAWSPSTSLTSTRESIFTPNSGFDTTIGVEGTGKYPMSLTAGASMRFGNRYRGLADFAMQDFTNALVYGESGATDATGAAGSRISVGLERLANVAGEYGSSYGMDTWALRLGFYYSTLPVAPAGSGGVNEMGLTAGFGIPVGFESLLNIALGVGQRGPVNADTAPKETFVRLGANISLSERWFVPTRRD